MFEHLHTTKPSWFCLHHSTGECARTTCSGSFTYLRQTHPPFGLQGALILLIGCCVSCVRHQISGAWIHYFSPVRSWHFTTARDEAVAWDSFGCCICPHCWQIPTFVYLTFLGDPLPWASKRIAVSWYQFSHCRTLPSDLWKGPAPVPSLWGPFQKLARDTKRMPCLHLRDRHEEVNISQLTNVFLLVCA